MNIKQGTRKGPQVLAWELLYHKVYKYVYVYDKGLVLTAGIVTIRMYTPFYIPPSPFHTTDQTNLVRFQCRTGEGVHIFFIIALFIDISTCI